MEYMAVQTMAKAAVTAIPEVAIVLPPPPPILMIHCWFLAQSPSGNVNEQIAGANTVRV
jgi:hypothetical protein